MTFAPYFTEPVVQYPGHAVSGPIAPVMEDYLVAPHVVLAAKAFLTTGDLGTMPLHVDMLQYARTSRERNSEQVYLSVPHTGYCLHYRITDLL